MIKKTKSGNVSIEQWAVIRIEGAGHIEAVAHDRANAILRYCWRRVSNAPTFNHDLWWRENAKKKHLVCQKIHISTAHIPGVPYASWRRPASKENRCEWDMGHKTIYIQQCESAGKHMLNGHVLCGLHFKTYLRKGELFLARK